MQESEAREAVVEACRELERSGLNQGTSGNLSLRFGDGLLVTPSGVAPRSLRAGDVVYMAMDGSWQGPLAPSSEWRIHRDLLAARPEFNAVVHAHPPYATIIAIQRREIPPLHYMIAAAGGPTIRCAPYATFGSEALSRHALAALRDRAACLLANHGLLAAGVTIDRAVWLANEVELLARQFHGCLQTGGPVLLSEAEIDEVVERFKGYGPKP